MSRETQRTDDTGSTDAGTLEVDLWTRRPVCGPRTTAIDRLGRLRSAGAVEDFSVETWPDEVTVRDGEGRHEVLALVERFESWAETAGVSVRPPFETRTASLLVGDSETVLRTPMLLAAAYDGGDLAGVYPCTDSDHTWTVAQFLDVVDPEADAAVTPDEVPGSIPEGG